MFLKVPKNSQEDTYSRDSFLINLPKRDSGTVVSLWIFLLIKTFFVDHPRWPVAYKLELFYLSNKYIVFREFKMGHKPVSGLKNLKTVIWNKLNYRVFKLLTGLQPIPNHWNLICKANCKNILWCLCVLSFVGRITSLFVGLMVLKSVWSRRWVNMKLIYFKGMLRLVLCTDGNTHSDRKWRILLEFV